MKHWLVIPLLFATGCVVNVQRPTPSNPPPAVTQSSNLLNQRVGMPLYPGSKLVSLETNGNGSSEGVFTTDDSITAVYGYFHNQFTARGWTRSELDFKDKATKLEASYQRQGVKLRFSLDQEGKSGRYKFEIQF